MDDKQAKPYKEESIGSKLVIFLGGVIALVAIVYGVYLFTGSSSEAPSSQIGKTRPAAVTSAKAGNVTAEYAGLNQKKDDEVYQRAVETGGSALPSVIGSAGYITSPGSFAESAKNALNSRSGSAPVKCTTDYAKKARQAGVSAFELKCQGCDASTLRQAGYTSGELANAGYSAAELKAGGYSAESLKNAGFSAAQLRAAGFSAEDLKGAGYSTKELLDAGFTPSNLLAAGVSPSELKQAGVSDKELLDAGVSPSSIDKKDCNLPKSKKKHGKKYCAKVGKGS